MSFLGRKISRAKWDFCESDDESVSQYPADAITNDLKTSNNSLSTWKIESIDEIDNIFLALLAGHSSHDTFDIVLLQFEELKSKNFLIDPSDGKTPYLFMKDHHFDLKNLSYKSLGDLAKLTHDAIKNDKCIRRRSTELLNLLVNAAKEKKINLSDIDEKLQEKVLKRINSSNQQ